MTGSFAAVKLQKPNGLMVKKVLSGEKWLQASSHRPQAGLLRLISRMAACGLQLVTCSIDLTCPDNRGTGLSQPVRQAGVPSLPRASSGLADTQIHRTSGLKFIPPLAGLLSLADARTRVLLTCSFLLLIQFTSIAQTKTQWVDSVFQTLSLPEKIGQLFMLPISSQTSQQEKELLLDQIKKYKPGSVLVTHGGPISHSHFLNKLQAQSNVPMLAAIHAEWGLGQTLDSTISFQKPLALGAIKNDSLIYQLGQEIGNQMKTLGLQVNFAPNADIHANDDLYPGTLRYFGDNKKRVATKSVWLMRGLKQSGVLAFAKHLANPKKERHIAIQDSSVVFDVNQIDTIGFYPYQKLMTEGVDGLLTSHLDFVLQGKKKPIPAPISELFVTEVIKNKLNYNGLTLAEIPYLKKITGKAQPGDAEQLGLTVGNDILVQPENLAAAVKKISKTVKKDAKLQEQLNTSVKKILATKFDVGLLKKTNINTDNLLSKLNSPKAKLLQQHLAEASITLLRNQEDIVPINLLEDKKFASVTFGKEVTNEFNHYLQKYVPFEKFSVTTLKDTLDLEKRLSKANVVVIGLFPPSKGFLLQIAPIIQRLSAHHKVIVCSFGDPEDLRFFDQQPTLLAAYSDDDLILKTTAQIIFGGLHSQGELPLMVTDSLREGQGIISETSNRFSYSLPEEVGMDSKTLEKIKTILQEAIDIGSTPGCQVLIAKDGKIIYEQSAGWFTYEKKNPVTDETIYDLASVTKVTATLQTIMFMHEKGLIDINKKISVYLPELKESNKKDFIIKDILTHQAGLWPFLPFWAQTVKDSTLMSDYYSKEKSEAFPFPVADDLFASKTMKDSLWQWIIKAKVREKPPRTVFDYRYSDMGFYMLQHLAEKLLNQPMEDFLEQNIYEPIGAYTVGYLPRQKFPASQIAPTEDDKLFRKKLLTGYVHDQGAAMHGGIAGHAGLFSTANDLAKLGQMWLQKGTYGGLRYFKPETFDLFTTKQYEGSRRGLGWDKSMPSEPAGPTSIYASAKTFGHTGFTGTCIWIDPEFNLVYIFLANRVYPDMTNNKILNANIRPRIQDVIYQSIFNYCKN
jgi:beta-N-acetylhexosaminidase